MIHVSPHKLLSLCHLCVIYGYGTCTSDTNGTETPEDQEGVVMDEWGPNWYLSGIATRISETVPQEKLNPTTCDGKFLELHIYLEPWTIIGLDKRTQEISMKAAIAMEWTDASLGWFRNKSDWRSQLQLESVFISPSHICMPDIIMEESVSENGFPRLQHEFAEVSVDNNGTVYYYYPMNLNIYCKMDNSDFPFDTQKCNISLWSLARGPYYIDVIPQHDEYYSILNGWLFTWYIPSAEWTVISHSVEKVWYMDGEEPYNYIRFLLTIQRRPIYYLVSLVLPAVVATAVASFGLFMGIGIEKTRLGLTAMLFMAIQLLTVSNEMPVTSTTVPLIGRLYTLLFVIISTGTLVATWITQYYTLLRVKPHPVPAYVYRFLYEIGAKVFLVDRKYYQVGAIYQHRHEHGTEEDGDDSANVTLNYAAGRHRHTDKKHKSSNLSSADDSSASESIHVQPAVLTPIQKVRIQWDVVFEVINRICLFSYTLATCGAMVWFFSYM